MRIVQTEKIVYGINGGFIRIPACQFQSDYSSIEIIIIEEGDSTIGKIGVEQID